MIVGHSKEVEPMFEGFFDGLGPCQKGKVNVEVGVASCPDAGLPVDEIEVALENPLRGVKGLERGAHARGRGLGGNRSIPQVPGRFRQR